ncbi:MAG: Gfo/Idh/MocA family oxidoreductase [Akkermansiaceae bacterium]|nr:Gfo/Idh/MocA family oxidoreductase [Akkermansiaceae bacterium]MCF7732303.1 Gfo/Idh/MocA family oxidoreductase [Akkermansiaceae bacterium]
MNIPTNTTRRQFLRHTGLAATAIGFPTIIPARVLGADAPSNKINILQIGCGRIGRGMDMPGILRQNSTRLVAVCDLDSLRVADAKTMVDGHYQKNNIALSTTTYGDYRRALEHPDIDAVSVSTPDHWHAEPVIAAAQMGKDIYVQKPLAMTIKEGRAVSDIVRANNRIFQIGSQQRSGAQFRIACEMVRNGRIGKVHTVRIGLPSDPSGGSTTEIPVPANLDYAMWLGCTPQASYTKDRVHAQGDKNKGSYDERPGWLRIEDYCLGMITGWGSHHVDIAHWGMDTEHTGPIAIEGKAEFPKSGLWTVHGPYHIEAKYANGATVIIDHTFPNGVRFEGSDGWIFVTRGAERVTSSDPIPKGNAAKALQASKPEILSTPLGADEIHLHDSPKNDHHLDWVTAMQTRKPAATTAEVAHRSTSACALGWISMKLGRKLTWNPEKEQFAGDDTANSMLSRPQRTPYGIDNMKKS